MISILLTTLIILSLFAVSLPVQSTPQTGYSPFVRQVQGGYELGNGAGLMFIAFNGSYFFNANGFVQKAFIESSVFLSQGIVGGSIQSVSNSSSRVSLLVSEFSGAVLNFTASSQVPGVELALSFQAVSLVPIASVSFIYPAATQPFINESRTVVDFGVWQYLYADLARQFSLSNLFNGTDFIQTVSTPLLLPGQLLILDPIHTYEIVGSCTPNPIIVGQMTTCTGTVSDQICGPCQTPVGDLRFLSSDSFVNPLNAQCTMTQFVLGVGQCSVTFTGVKATTDAGITVQWFFNGFPKTNCNEPNCIAAISPVLVINNPPITASDNDVWIEWLPYSPLLILGIIRRREQKKERRDDRTRIRILHAKPGIQTA